MYAIILAAGKGTRMGGDLPKVLHTLGGQPLLMRPLKMLLAQGADPAVVVVGYQGAKVEAAVREAFGSEGEAIAFAEQAQQLGTGHAVSCAVVALPPGPVDAPVIITAGDVPLLRASTVKALLEATSAGALLAVATFRPPRATGYGRIVRGADGQAVAIVEERDATSRQRDIDECNAGVYCVRLGFLRDALPRIGAQNVQGEFYLTDLVADAAREGRVETVEADALEVTGVNTSQQLAALEAAVSSGAVADPD